jgi:gamma-glutamylcyclotransferase (GGCT)/AIG2-like uncharacterized protein YtfP
MERYKVFVYGTLRPGQSNYRWLLAGHTDQEQPATAPGIALFGASIPYAIPSPGARAVGSLITITPACYDDVLTDLDRLEGYRPHRPDRSHYVRVTRTVIAADATPHTAWIYLAGPNAIHPRMRRIPGDDWLVNSPVS